jgi:polyisoprenoid-binding protein YceI
MNAQQNGKIMNNFKPTVRKISVLTAAILFTFLTSQAQVRYTQNAAKISIAGTSTLHDWHMASSEVTCEAVFETNAKGEPVRLTSLNVTLPAESLKSGKGAMDKNAYSALKTDVQKQIAFQLVSAELSSKTIESKGKLKIAGTSKQIDLASAYVTLPDHSIQCKGSKKILMTDYGVEPPTFMFGSVTTGNEITVSFELILVPANIKPVTLN